MFARNKEATKLADWQATQRSLEQAVVNTRRQARTSNQALDTATRACQLTSKTQSRYIQHFVRSSLSALPTESTREDHEAALSTWQKLLDRVEAHTGPMHSNGSTNRPPLDGEQTKLLRHSITEVTRLEADLAAALSNVITADEARNTAERELTDHNGNRPPGSDKAIDGFAKHITELESQADSIKATIRVASADHHEYLRLTSELRVSDAEAAMALADDADAQKMQTALNKVTKQSADYQRDAGRAQQRVEVLESRLHDVKQQLVAVRKEHDQAKLQQLSQLDADAEAAVADAVCQAQLAFEALNNTRSETNRYLPSGRVASLARLKLESSSVSTVSKAVRL